jgi:putative transposase
MAQVDDARLSAALSDVLAQGDTKELFRAVLRTALQELIEEELTAAIGAAAHERTETRSNQRNGGRSKTLSTPAGDVELRTPKVRVGSFFPSLLGPRRRGRRGSRRLPEPAAGPHRLPVRVLRRDLRLEARIDGRVVSRAVVVATGVAADGTREVLGVDVGDSEDEVFWTAFLRSLRTRGLTGVRLVISDAHAGLKGRRRPPGAGRRLAALQGPVRAQRPGLANKQHGEMVPATIRTVFAQPDAQAAREQLHAVVDMRRAKFPAVARCCSMPNRTCSPTPTSPDRTGGGSGRPTRWSASTRRSSAAATSSPSSPTTPPSSGSSAPCYWRSTTKGRSQTAPTSAEHSVAQLHA